ncbi:MAG TPA: RsmB/NOP family class I SAM-dependent RNA methyltransferase [Candidatus Choladousia intestinavium]|uniref:RsmB/NOP family class I SAM-dependent RNA methyltransferase n=1 Tax=Candidatus Choladousia intestinavium TaxID=2840727 RepID=A0A9D1ACQ5_9FIRM|nr:RsmB/NOP family class I SAM-dependent RNA methyltransferase [Candidatus Choladousia intestinavium]
MELPEKFLERMREMLGEEYEEFLETYREPREFGLRVNPLKISPEEFERAVPFHLERIPWTKNGYYYKKEDDPARHPFYYAGLYYLQEPSAMAPGELLPVRPGERVLDLCAAPGGKATALGARLLGQGLLAANEISASRAKALLKNLEVFGITNSLVLHEVPARLEERFAGYFDKILVDAPCSGEGMFRKDGANARAWSLEKVKSCAVIQKDITVRAAKMLRSGGMLLYSTCTFSPEENEQVVSHVLKECPELHLTELPGDFGFSPGRPELGGGEETLKKCARLFPHKIRGEGHFMALFQKEGELSPAFYRKPSGESRLSREEEKLLELFFKDISKSFQKNRIESRCGQIYYQPEIQPPIGGLDFLRSGLYLGEMKRNRFEPSQSLAMALRKEEYASSLDFSPEDPRILRYLSGETIETEHMDTARDKGWQLVCVSGFPLGWGKLVNGTLKNKYHPGWRMQR